MTLHELTPRKWRATALASALALLTTTMPMSAETAPATVKRASTQTPIQHVIVIIGENRTFDEVYGTYQPVQGQTIDNLLSKGIVNADGTPGANFATAQQDSALLKITDRYQISPQRKSPYSVLPTPLVGGPTNPFFTTLEQAMEAENGLADDYYQYLLTGGTGLQAGQPDTRITNVFNLASGPFQLTNSTTHPYDVYDNSPVHRFYQMWQQLDCNVSYASTSNPSGCLADTFPWVETSIGAGSNGRPHALQFNQASTGEGATAMSFYNVQQGDAPYLKMLADTYAMSDNYHQAVNGGTGANHIMMGTGDAIWFSDGNGNPLQPPHNQLAGIGSANQGYVDEIENPDPAPSTNNWYAEDGYGGGSYGSPSYGGGSYSNCSDPTAHGVPAVLNYLATLPYHPNPNCDQNRWYLLNNYNPGYFGDGTNAYTDNNDANTVFTIPPSSVRNIGDELLENNISWKYYGDQWNRYLQDKYFQNPLDIYCNICNFFQYSTSIMTNDAVRTAHLQDTTDLYNDIASGNLPAVSYVKPSGLVDGHPASSKLDLFEGFTKKIVDLVQANPDLWQTTAIFVTFDEGGGYYDSGYVEPVDFFGDGTRIPLIVVSPFTAAGHVSHQYNDHVSILKFIEYNWSLPPITGRSRDNLPNPTQTGANPYVPTNAPAIGDLTDLFNFGGSKK
ncbi:MAG: alkaline phosphatase family protein [Candidatus Korobacteraceae bacterium]